jgi:hypothetical protein
MKGRRGPGTLSLVVGVAPAANSTRSSKDTRYSRTEVVVCRVLPATQLPDYVSLEMYGAVWRLDARLLRYGKNTKTVNRSTETETLLYVLVERSTDLTRSDNVWSMDGHASLSLEKERAKMHRLIDVEGVHTTVVLLANIS